MSQMEEGPSRLSLSGGGTGGGSPRKYGAGGVQKAREERAGSGSSKRVGSWREMRNANFLIQQCVTILSKTRIQNTFDSHLTSSLSLLRLLSKLAN